MEFWPLDQNNKVTPPELKPPRALQKILSHFTHNSTFLHMRALSVTTVIAKREREILTCPKEEQ